MIPTEALAWLYERQFFGIKLGLATPQRLLAALGHPEKHLRFLHVAGTNGKGSVCAFCDQILRTAGVRTGLFTSPHLIDFGERIRVDGANMPAAEIASGLTELRDLIETWEPPPTFFEITLVLALPWFARQGVEVVVLETGMGGRLDATNVVQPEVCVITPISFDHQAWLGSSLAEIAGEKAGIIKAGVPVVICPQEPEAEEVLLRRAAEVGAPVIRVERPWPGGVSLAGSHQRWNAAAAVEACAVLQQASRSVAAQAVAATTWPGRFQRCGDRCIIDGAHNAAAIRRLVATWQEVFGERRAHVIFGTLQDKNPEELLPLLLPLASDFSLVPVRSARGVDPAQMLPMLAGTPATVHQNFAEAFAALPTDGELVLVAGSLFLAGEALAWFGEQSPPTPGSQ
jgi:dihydrofolate synthase/folylpolyglutamate synthase